MSVVVVDFSAPFVYSPAHNGVFAEGGGWRGVAGGRPGGIRIGTGVSAGNGRGFIFAQDDGLHGPPQHFGEAFVEVVDV